jgi:putative transposase
LFLRSLDAARKRLKFDVWAYAVMDEHVHLLVRPQEEEYRMAEVLTAIKAPFAKALIREARSCQSPMLSKVGIRRRDGSMSYRVWEAGGGYDRNMFTPEAIRACMSYIHANPVRAGLCDAEVDWRWSSAGWYAGMECGFEVDPCDVVFTDASWRGR